jgi:glycosyltransferase involved in cell wall biosynthesis
MKSGPIPVAIFVDRFIAGGTQRQMVELMARLDRVRFRVHPVCFHAVGVWFPRVSLLDEPVAVFPIHGFAKPGTYKQLLAFAQWCRAKGIAILQTCELYSNIFGLPGGMLASVPVRIGSRRGMVETPAQQRMQKYAYNAAHRVVANSQAAAESLRHEGVAADRIVVIPNGIDPTLFGQREYRVRPRTIVMVACLREEKRIDVLLDAAPLILARHPEAEILIVGDGDCRDELEARARSNQVADRVRFLGHRDDVPAVLAGADLFVLPSRSEAFPNAIVEAMMSGLPVVASSVGGIPELVEEGRTGRLVPPGDPVHLAAAVIEILNHPDRATHMGQTARRRIEEQYSFDRMVHQFEALYLGEIAARNAAEREREVA